MFKFYVSTVIEASKEVKIKVPLHAAEIIKLAVELRSNSEIMTYMQENYGTKWKGTGQIRKVHTLLQCFIVFNYYDMFEKFCVENSIKIFNTDLDVKSNKQSDGTYARFYMIIFLREVVGMKPPIEIIV